MTEEQLEELGRVARLYQPSSDSPATAGELLRLLEERERLLAALEILSYTIVVREEDAHITGPGIQGAREAIAYAEEAA